MSFDFDAAVRVPHRMQPGLRRLAPGASQLTPAVEPHRGVSRHLREKLAVLWAFRGQALLRQPGFDPGPALAVLSAQAEGEHPLAFRRQGDDWLAPGLGWALDAQLRPLALGNDWPEVGTLLAEIAPDWRRAALLSLALAEDFAIVDGASGSLPWLAVALPSMWAPESMIGKHFTALHARVADNAALLAAAEPLLRLITGATPPTPEAVAGDGSDRWERFVWTFSPHPRLHAHPRRVDPAGWPAGLDGAALAAQTWWRTERQTFIPVPAAAAGSPQAVFTIRVDVRPLAQAITLPAQAARLHAALASMSDAVLAYRGLAGVQAGLLRWLARRAEGDDETLP